LDDGVGDTLESVGATSGVNTSVSINALDIASPTMERQAMRRRGTPAAARAKVFDRVAFHPELELPSLAVSQELRVARCFPAGHPRLVAKFQTMEPLYVEIALKPEHDHLARWHIGKRVSRRASCNDGAMPCPKPYITLSHRPAAEHRQASA
jgi:hypothetical protein